MIDKLLLNVPTTARPTEIPFLRDRLGCDEFLCFYSPYNDASGFALRIWWADQCSQFRYRVYCTGALEMPPPNDIHSRVAEMVARTGVSSWKAAQLVTEESWSETQKVFDRMLLNRVPELDQEHVISASEFKAAMRLGKELAAIPNLDQPDVVDGQTTRIVGRFEDGVRVDRLSFGGPFDDRNGVSDILRQLRDACAAGNVTE